MRDLKHSLNQEVLHSQNFFYFTKRLVPVADVPKVLQQARVDGEQESQQVTVKLKVPAVK